MRLHRRLCPLLATVAAAVSGIHPADVAAQPMSRKTKQLARAHDDSAAKLYRAGRYAAAIDEYRAAYALVPAPRVLFNLCQAYRGAGRKPDALDCYRDYLAKVAARAETSRASRDQGLDEIARECVDSLAREAAAQPQVVAAGESLPAPPEAPGGAIVARPAISPGRLDSPPPADSSVLTSSSATRALVSSAPPDVPRRRRWPLYAGIGVGIAVAAAAAIVAIVVATRPSDPMLWDAR